MTDAPAVTAEIDPGAEHVRAVARGGALNLVGSIIYGAANFVFLAIVTNALGPEQAGPVVVAIAIFTVVSRVAELGASTGLVRMISRDRAVGRPDRIAPTIAAACLPVLMVGTACAFVLVWCAPALAELFGGGKQTAEIARQVRILAPFVPIASIYTVLVQGSRGFGTMNVLVGVDKIGRALALVALTGVLVATGGGATGVVLLWGVTTAVATVVTIGFVVALTRRCTRGVTPAADGSHRKVVAAFWAFSLPRAAGQSFDVAVLWLDTLLVAALIGPTAAGIYAAGSRFLLIGTFTAEAIQQAVAPRVSALITLDQHDEAHAVIRQATSWQAAITWPIYLGVIAFSGVLLGAFGPEYVQAQGALVLLSIGLLIAVVGGPSDAVILMSGRSRQSLANSTVAFTVNLVGNIVLVPIWGITAAGGVWAATLIVAAFLPARQARRSLGLAPWSRELARTIAVAVATVGTACVLALLTLGATVTGMVAAVVLGAAGYAACMWWQRESMHLQTLLESLRGGARRTVSDPRPFRPTPTLEHS
jgi:O-antigen/teichoic acid export membrane protein